MEIRTIPLDAYNGSIILQNYQDHIARFILSGERFKEDAELLTVLMQYNGACTLDRKSYANANACDFNCASCKHSIYKMLDVKRKFFIQKCQGLCTRYPKEGDEWELSLVMRDPRVPKYQSFFFSCTNAVQDKNILDIIYETICAMDKTLFTDAQYRYIKIRRFDMPRALDVSMIANQVIMARLRDEQ